MAMLFTISSGPLRRRGNGSPPAPYNFTRRDLGYSGYSYFYTEWFIRKPLGQEQQLLLCGASVHVLKNAAGGLTAVKPVSRMEESSCPGKGQPGDEG